MSISQRIGFDARLLGAFGIGRYISGLLPPLAAMLAERLTVFVTARDTALVRAMIGGGPAVIVSNAQPYRFEEQSSFLATLVRANLALVHFPHYNLPVFNRGRFVVTIHDLFSYDFPEIHSGPIPRRVNRALLAGAVKRAAAIITPSRATAEAVARRFPKASAKIVSIPEAADDRFSEERSDGRATWLDYFRIRPPYFFYLGQWKAYKNVPRLIEAFGEVLARRPDCQLVIAGNDPRHPEVPAAARRLPPGSVVLPGRLPDDAVPELYRSATAVVLPSLAEGFGLPVLEAMACGARVVCSDIPVLHEVAAGVAIFCDPSDSASFAQGMLEALTPAPGDRRRELGVARARTFSWRAAAEETVRVYRRVLKA